MCCVADGMCAAGNGNGDGAATDAVFILLRLNIISK